MGDRGDEVEWRVPVHPATRVGVVFLGAVLGGVILGSINLILPEWERGLVLTGYLAGTGRGLLVGARFGSEKVVVRNIWWTSRVATADVTRVRPQWTAGPLNTAGPVLIARGRRLPIPLHSAMCWGSKKRSTRDAAIDRGLRRWGQRHGIRVDL